MSKQQLIDELKDRADGGSKTEEYDCGFSAGLITAIQLVERHIIEDKTLKALLDVHENADSIYDSYTSEQEELEGWEMEVLFKALTAFEDCP